VEIPVSESPFPNLLHPHTVSDFTAVFRTWLEEAHQRARKLQDQRQDWANATSFGTDRYQRLLHTAGGLTHSLNGLEFVRDTQKGTQSLLFRLPHVVLYVLRVEGNNPRGRIRQTGRLRRELLADDSVVCPEADSTDPALLPLSVKPLSVKDALLGNDRKLLLLLWSGTKEEGLTGLWVGQGVQKDENNVITWNWVSPLYQRDRSDGLEEGGSPHLGPNGPQPDLFSGPTAFDQPEPELPLRPKQAPTRETGGTSA